MVINPTLSKGTVNSINKELEELFARSGVFCRIFSRAKSSGSIEKKINIKEYSPDGKRMQDLLGVRVVLYFSDDIKHVISILKAKYNLVDIEIDSQKENEFAPARTNIIFQVPDIYSSEFDEVSEHYNSLIDNTFEVQVRTIFSEGWHEVEHDLRYKFQDDWTSHKDLSRNLNGIFASLQSSEWAMEKLFGEIAYRAYKASDWSTMLRNKFRMRVSFDDLDNYLIKAFNEDPTFAKGIYRCSRSAVLKYISEVPLNSNNVIYLANYLNEFSEDILAITPKILLDGFKNIQR